MYRSVESALPIFGISSLRCKGPGNLGTTLGEIWLLIPGPIDFFWVLGSFVPTSFQLEINLWVRQSEQLFYLNGSKFAWKFEKKDLCQIGGFQSKWWKSHCASVLRAVPILYMRGHTSARTKRVNLASQECGAAFLSWLPCGCLWKGMDWVP